MTRPGGVLLSIVTTAGPCPACQTDSGSEYYGGPGRRCHCQSLDRGTQAQAQRLAGIMIIMNCTVTGPGRDSDDAGPESEPRPGRRADSETVTDSRAGTIPAF
jgi:hypothetical protein